MKHIKYTYIASNISYILLFILTLLLIAPVDLIFDTVIFSGTSYGIGKIVDDINTIVLSEIPFLLKAFILLYSLTFIYACVRSVKRNEPLPMHMFYRSFIGLLLYFFYMITIDMLLTIFKVSDNWDIAFQLIESFAIFVFALMIFYAVYIFSMWSSVGYKNEEIKRYIKNRTGIYDSLCACVDGINRHPEIQKS